MKKDGSHDGNKSEWKPITVLKLEKKKIGWSPNLKKSVFFNDSTERATIQELKRVREADILTVYDQLEDRTMFIELKEPEREQFDDIYSRYLDSGGQILYKRKKEGRKTIIFFTLAKDQAKGVPPDVPEKRSLFEQ